MKWILCTGTCRCNSGICHLYPYHIFQISSPSSTWFLVTGMLIGPHGLGILDSGRNMELNAELGVFSCSLQSESISL